MKILILGGSGMLGRTLAAATREGGHEVIVHANSASGEEYVHADLTEAGSIGRLVGSLGPNVVVNLVALTNVDRCEIDPDLAFKMNAKIPAALALAADQNMRLIHISTDHVYDREGADPSSETDTKLRNLYAITKLAGELPIQASSGVVLRTNFFGPSADPRRKSFSDAIRSALESGEGFSGFNDVYFNPLTMSRLSSEILRVVNNWRPGVYNLGSRGGLSKFRFAQLVAKRYGFDSQQLRSRSLSDADLAARRPLGMIMDVAAFEAAYDIVLPTLEDEIESLEL